MGQTTVKIRKITACLLAERKMADKVHAAVCVFFLFLLSAAEPKT